MSGHEAEHTQTRFKEPPMVGEDLRPKEGNRLADIPRGKFEDTVDKLAAEGTSRAMFERLGTDWGFRRAVVRFMGAGYDEKTLFERLALEKDERRKNRRRLRGSGYGPDTLEEFCKLAFYETRTFVRIAAWSLVQRVAQKSEGSSPVRQVLSVERLESFKALLPPAGEKNCGETAVAMLADALVCSCHSAAAHATSPGGYQEYAKSVRHSGVGIGQTEQVKNEFYELIETDPILFLELLSVSFCKLIVGQNNKKAQALHELLKPDFGIISVTFEACPELDIGEALSYFCTHVAEWRSLRESYPDPREYYSVVFCCRRMEHLKDRLIRDQLLGLSGTLARGFCITTWKDLNTIKEKIWFPSCPFCDKPLYTPPGVTLYSKEKDRERLRVW